MNTTTKPGVLAVMDDIDGILNAPAAIRTAEMRRQQKALREARATVVHLMAAADALAPRYCDMTTVRGRNEMTRRLKHLSAMLANAQGAA